MGPERDELRDEQEEDFHADQDEFRADEEYDDYAPRSIFSTGWFRAVLVLAALTVAVVVALPHLLNWLAPVPPPVTESARVTQRVKPASVPASSPASPPTRSEVAASSRSAPLKPTGPTMPALTANASHGAAVSPKASPASELARTAARREKGAAIPGGSSSTRAETQGTYWVQLGAFKDATNAERLAKRLKAQGFSVQVATVMRREGTAATDGIAAGTFHVVRAGAFPDRQRALAARDQLGARGYSGFLAQGAAK